MATRVPLLHETIWPFSFWPLQSFPCRALFFLFDLSPFLKSDHRHWWRLVCPPFPWWISDLCSSLEVRFIKAKNMSTRLSDPRFSHYLYGGTHYKPTIFQNASPVMRLQKHLMKIRGRIRSGIGSATRPWMTFLSQPSLGPDVVLAFRELSHGRQQETLHTASYQS